MIHTLLEPVFQPIVDQAGNPFAYEALMRIKGNPLSPAGMVKRWERTGFIRTADLAMLRRVAEMLALVGTTPRVAVNVSIATIEAAGDEYVEALVNLAPYARRLIVELTETAAVSDASALLRFYGLCRERGFAIALDDCKPGHPYGSAAFIRKFKPQFVKLDGDYLQQCFKGNELDWLLETVAVAHENEAAVIAEYVSTEALRAFAFRVGADYVQGFALGKPAALPSLSAKNYSAPLPSPEKDAYRNAFTTTRSNSLQEVDVQLREQMAALAITELIRADTRET